MDAKRRGLMAALVLGLVSGPAVALGAAGVFSSGAPEAIAVGPTPFVVTAQAAPASDTTPADLQATLDLWTACTADGAAFVSSEAAGTITDVEQAALDALRDICREAGMPLPDAIPTAATDPVVVRTVTVSAAPSTSTTAGGGYDDDHGYEDEHEHEDEHEDEHEHEGEDD